MENLKCDFLKGYGSGHFGDADFIEIEWRKWAAEIREKTNDIRELESSLKSLGAKFQ
jgi:hypothetical protein